MKSDSSCLLLNFRLRSWLSPVLDLLAVVFIWTKSLLVVKMCNAFMFGSEFGRLCGIAAQEKERDERFRRTYWNKSSVELCL